MTSLSSQLAFLITTLIVCTLWGRVLWFFADYFRGFNSLVFHAMTFTRRSHGELKALFLGAIYYLFGLLAAFLLWAAFAFGQPIGFALSPMHVPLIVLGIVGQISLSNLLVSLYCELIPGRAPAERLGELQSIPWIRGVMDLPPRLAPTAAALGGVVEEFFFRGVVLQVLVQQLRVPDFLAITVAGALFLLQQLLQVQTLFQAVLIGAGCIAISLVGGALVICTGSITPALLCHASFVVFYLDRQRSAR